MTCTHMRWSFVAVVAAVALCSLSVHHVSAAPLPTSALVEAFEKDGFHVDRMHTLATGPRGFLATSQNVTLLSSGKGKQVCFV